MFNFLDSGIATATWFPKFPKKALLKKNGVVLTKDFRFEKDLRKASNLEIKKAFGEDKEIIRERAYHAWIHGYAYRNGEAYSLWDDEEAAK